MTPESPRCLTRPVALNLRPAVAPLCGFVCGCAAVPVAPTPVTAGPVGFGLGYSQAATSHVISLEAGERELRSSIGPLTLRFPVIFKVAVASADPSNTFWSEATTDIRVGRRFRWGSEARASLRLDATVTPALLIVGLAGGAGSFGAQVTAVGRLPVLDFFVFGGAEAAAGISAWQLSHSADALSARVHGIVTLGVEVRRAPGSLSLFVGRQWTREHASRRQFVGDQDVSESPAPQWETTTASSRGASWLVGLAVVFGVAPARPEALPPETEDASASD